jgi:hypothetical protein
MTKPASQERAAATVARTREIARWLETVGASPTEMAVDFADLLSAARLVDEMLSKLVQLDVRNAQQADEALQLLGGMSAQLLCNGPLPTSTVGGIYARPPRSELPNNSCGRSQLYRIGRRARQATEFVQRIRDESNVVSCCSHRPS